MALDIDKPPIYDALTRESQDKISDVWERWMSTFVDTLSNYLTQNGILISRITTKRRDELQNVENGQVIYNTDDNKFQGYEDGTWKDFTLV